MRVYELGADYENYRQISFLTYRAFWRWRQRFDGNPVKRYWTGKEKFRFFTRDCPKGDMPGLTGSIPVFTLKAVKVLAEFLEPNGELIKIRCQQDTLFLYNVTRIVDALDEEFSEFVRFLDGSFFIGGLCSFFEDRLTRAVIFKLPQWRMGPAYVTELFVQKVKEHGLKGFSFRLVWSTEEELDPDPSGAVIITT